MLCYKDMSFCGSQNCKNACGRQLLDEDIKKARELDLPISIATFCSDSGELVE